jgi:hypothetical protein
MYFAEIGQPVASPCEVTVLHGLPGMGVAFDAVLLDEPYRRLRVFTEPV